MGNPVVDGSVSAVAMEEETSGLTFLLTARPRLSDLTAKMSFTIYFSLSSLCLGIVSILCSVMDI